MRAHLVKSSGYPYVFIHGEISPELMRSLELETSFLVQNPDRVISGREEKLLRAGKKREDIEPWDGRIRLMRKSKNGHWYFPIGLLSGVKRVMMWHGIQPDVELYWNISGKNVDIDWKGPDLRDYQIEAYMTARTEERCITQLPTGSGKTLCAIKLMAAIKKPTLIVVHTKELLRQWDDAIRKNTSIIPCVFNDKQKEFGDVTIAMVQSLDHYLKSKKKLPNFDVIILDESHHTPSDTFYNLAMNSDAMYRFGFTATTKREDGTDLLMIAALGHIATTMKPEDLIELNHLTLPKFEFIDVPPTLISGRTYGQIYKSGIVMNNARNKLIAARSRQLVAEGRQVYIHVEQIAHGKILSDMTGYKFTHASTKTRDADIQEFRDGSIRCLISTLLGEGVDIPNISAIVMAGGRKTEIGTIQKVGRALRPSDREDAIVVDFLDKGKYLSTHSVDRYNAYVKFFGDYVVGDTE